MSAPTRLISIANVVVAAAALVAGCGTSSHAPPPPAGPAITEELVLTTPMAVPVPAYADDVLPQYSASIVTDLVPVDTLTPLDGVSWPSAFVAWETRLRAMIGSAANAVEGGAGRITPCGVSGAGTFGVIALQQGGVRVGPRFSYSAQVRCGDFWQGYVMHLWGGTAAVAPPPMAAKEAWLRRSVRWAKLPDGQVTTPRNSPVSRSFSYTSGTSTTEAQTLSATLGLDGTFDWLKLSATLTRTLSTSVTVSSQASNQTTLTCSPDPASTATSFNCSFWQIEEIYEVVDRDGAPWTDAFYSPTPIPALHNLIGDRSTFKTAIVGF